MEGLTRTEIRAFVRDHLDVDDQELPDTLLDFFINDGHFRIDNYSDQWSFRDVEYEFDSEADVAAYDVSSALLRVTGITAPLARIVDISSADDGIIPQADHHQMRRRFSGSTESATPRWWSRRGNDVYLWPTPSAVVTYTIDGYRRSDNSWISDDDEPDFPEEFHELIGWYALSRGYAQQDDLEASTFFRNEFAQQLKERAKQYLPRHDEGPATIIGDTRSGSDMPARLRLDWERG